MCLVLFPFDPNKDIVLTMDWYGVFLPVLVRIKSHPKISAIPSLLVN